MWGLLSWPAAVSNIAAQHHLLHTVAVQVLALTFDDGPEASGLNPVLDVLEKHGIKATFFWNAPNLQPGANPAYKVRGCTTHVLQRACAEYGSNHGICWQVLHLLCARIRIRSLSFTTQRLPSFVGCIVVYYW
jgi:hypothetical protein